jgi:hypothetical protein
MEVYLEDPRHGGRGRISAGRYFGFYTPVDALP